MKDNLNAAEEEVERRRYLFAREAENQVQSVRLMTQRPQRAAQPG